MLRTIERAGFTKTSYCNYCKHCIIWASSWLENRRIMEILQGLRPRLWRCGIATTRWRDDNVRRRRRYWVADGPASLRSRWQTPKYSTSNAPLQALMRQRSFL